MSDRQPKISLVMAALNAEAYIGEALESVAASGAGLDVEVVLADGGSRDGTLAIARRFPFVTVLPGGDTGIYAGFNRGVAAARGAIVGFLNSDDFLIGSALAVVAAAFERHPDALMASGGIRVGQNSADAVTLSQEACLSLEGLLFGIPAINGRFFRLDFARTACRFDETIGLSADRKVMIEIAREDVTSVRIDEVIYFYRSHRQSSTIAGDAAGRRRVYDAEQALVQSLQNTYQPETSDRRALEAYRALLAVKTMRAGRGALREARLAGVDWSALPRGLAAWWRWRLRLSGY